MAIESEWPIYVCNSFDAAAVGLTFTYSCHFVWKYIAQRCINKKFINFFYIVAFSLLTVDLAIITLVFFDQEAMDIDGWILMTHSTCYIAYMLLTISTLVHIATGLKMQIQRNYFNTNKKIWSNYIFCLSLLACTISIQLIAKLSNFQNISEEILSICYTILGFLLLVSYLFSFLRLIQCMNKGIMKDVDTEFERRNLKCQTIWIVISLAIYITQSLFFYFQLSSAIEHQKLTKKILVVYVSTMIPRDILPLVFTIHSHHENYHQIDICSEADDTIEILRKQEYMTLTMQIIDPLGNVGNLDKQSQSLAQSVAGSNLGTLHESGLHQQKNGTIHPANLDSLYTESVRETSIITGQNSFINKTISTSHYMQNTTSSGQNRRKKNLIQIETSANNSSSIDSSTIRRGQRRREQQNANRLNKSKRSNKRLNNSSLISDTDFGARAVLYQVQEGDSDIEEEDDDISALETSEDLLYGLGAGQTLK